MCAYVKALPENLGYCIFVCVSMLMYNDLHIIMRELLLKHFVVRPDMTNFKSQHLGG